jgi:alpha-galactosidase
MLRRLILAHYTPRPNGQILQPPFCEGAWGAQSESSHLAKIRWLRENRIPTECYWIDAGWYGDRPIAEAADGSTSGWMKQVGSWFANPEAYPRGFKAIGDAARAAGLGFLLWVEPERAFEGTQVVREHPVWLLGPVPSGNTNGVNFMVNLGNPEARRHITDLVSSLIDEGGITCYRQDFNDLRVPELFAVADAPDRVGMTEIGHITGLYAFWDELLARHPGLIIDNCAGGGQRIDLETIARSVPLWRSDLQCWPFDPLAMQTQTQGLAPWIPLSAAVCEASTQYALRSALGAGLVTHWSSQALDGGIDLPVEAIRRLMDETLAMRKYFYGDFYPLLSFSLAGDAWAAWQYDRPDLGEGMIVAFRRHESPFAHWEARLQGLDPERNYDLRSWDDDHTWRSTGRQLITEGFGVTIADRPGSALFTYKRV